MNIAIFTRKYAAEKFTVFTSFSTKHITARHSKRKNNALAVRHSAEAPILFASPASTMMMIACHEVYYFDFTFTCAKEYTLYISPRTGLQHSLLAATCLPPSSLPGEL